MANGTRRTSAQRRDSGDMERSYRKISGGKYQKKRKKKGQKVSAILIILIATLLICGIAAVSLYIYNNQNGVFPEGTMLAGVNIGGMTQSQAITAIEDATKSTYSETPMVVTVLDSQISIDPTVSEVSLDVTKAVKAAFKSRNTCKDLSFVPYLSINGDAIKEALNTLGEKYSSTLSQSTYEVTGTAPNQELVVHLGTPEYGLDMNKLYDLVLQAYSDNVFTVEGACEQLNPKDIDLEAILNEYYVAPKDAYYDKATGKFVAGVDGYGFDIEEAKTQLAKAEDGSTVTIPFKSVGSEYKDILGSYVATESTSDVDRNTNLRLACEAINGTIIKPGETFSYNKVLGERTEAKGYRPGPSYADGREVTTIGGGICQVSSALYYCAMLADLEIVDRSNHGFAVSYVPLGMDAAVSWDSLDFRFKNDTDHPIRIEAIADDSSTIVMLSGTDDKDYYVEMRYEVLATYTAETVYETYAPDNTDGYTQGDVIIKPHTGYEIQTYRSKYSKETKTLIEEEKETTSTYKKQDKVLCQITGTNVEETTPGIGNGGVTEDGGLLP